MRSSCSSEATRVLESRVKNGKFITLFLGDLMGLGLIASTSTLGMRLGMWEGVKRVSESTLGVDRGLPSRRRILSAVKETAREDVLGPILLAQFEIYFGWGSLLSLAPCMTEYLEMSTGFEKNGALHVLPTASLTVLWRASDGAKSPYEACVGLCIREPGCALWGLCGCAEGSRAPGPRLLENEAWRAEFIEVWWCDEVEDEKDFWWEAPNREVGGAGLGLDGSPPRSIKVFRFKGLIGGGGITPERAFLAEADTSISLPGDGILVGGRSCEAANCMSQDQSQKFDDLCDPYQILIVVLHAQQQKPEWKSPWGYKAAMGCILDRPALTTFEGCELRYGVSVNVNKKHGPAY